MSDQYTKKFFFKNHMNFLLFFHLTGKDSIPEVVQFIKDNKTIKNFIPQISASQGYRDNCNQDYAMFGDIFTNLVDKALNVKSLKLSKEEKEYIKSIKILDSTLISMCLKYFEWAEYRGKAGAIKIHTLLDLESFCPEKIFMTSGKPHYSLLIDLMGLKPNSTCLFDRGYTNYKVYDSMCSNDIFFITRLKKNASIEIPERYQLHQEIIISLVTVK